MVLLPNIFTVVQNSRTPFHNTFKNMISKETFCLLLVVAAIIVSGNVVCGDFEYNAKTPILNASVTTRSLCSTCTTIIDGIINSVRTNKPLKNLQLIVVPICLILKYPVQLCFSIIDAYGPTVYEVFEMTTTNSLQICNMLREGICPNVNVPQHEWSVNIPNAAKPPLMDLPLPQGGSPLLKVLHLTDIHEDLFYTKGSVTNCNEPLCCRSVSKPKPNEPVQPAGRWGSYKCDSPAEMVEKTLQHIAAQHPDIDYIMVTGDLPPHDIWQQNRSEVLRVIRKSYQQLKQAFPYTEIIPNIGNHELVPDGSYAPPWVQKSQFKMSWLLSELYSLWKDWLPPSANSTFFQGGFYSISIRPGLRVISLNTVYCYNLNWWLYVNSTDPNQQLAWLVGQLQEAENIGEKVHIIGHIAPGDVGCLKTWSANFYKIVNRYEDTVTAIFNGHTHADEFKVFYDDVNYARPVSVSYIAPSLTSHDGYNPAYRIYYIDAQSTREVMDYETWILDLVKANYQNQLEWVYSYSAKNAYNLPSLRPIAWNNLIQRMKEDNNIFQTFYMNYHRYSLVSKPIKESDKDQILCSLKSGKSHSSQIFCK